MAVVIPPWLDTKPSDFLAAAQAGAKVGTELRGQNLDHSARMAAIAAQQAEAGMRAQEESERTAVAREAERNRTELQTRAAANLFQQQQMRQRAIDSGMDPVQAWLQFPGTTSGSPGAGVFGALSNERRATSPLQPVMDPNNPGRTAGFQSGSRFYPLPTPKAGTAKFDPYQAAAIKHLTTTIANSSKQLATMLPGDPRRRQFVTDVLDSKEALKKLGVPIDGQVSQTAGQAPQPSQGQVRGLPQKGEVINGHTFLGGDPADKNSWQEVNPEGSSFIGAPGQPNQAALPGGMQDNQPVPDETENQVPNEEEQ